MEQNKTTSLSGDGGGGLVLAVVVTVVIYNSMICGRIIGVL